MLGKQEPTLCLRGRSNLKVAQEETAKNFKDSIGVLVSSALDGGIWSFGQKSRYTDDMSGWTRLHPVGPGIVRDSFVQTSGCVPSFLPDLPPSVR